MQKASIFCIKFKNFVEIYKKDFYNIISADCLRQSALIILLRKKHK